MLLCCEKRDCLYQIRFFSQRAQNFVCQRAKSSREIQTFFGSGSSPVCLLSFSLVVYLVLMHSSWSHLVEVDDEDDVVPEARDPVSGGHGDDEGEQVVNERVERLVHERSPRQVSNGLQPGRQFYKNVKQGTNKHGGSTFGHLFSKQPHFRYLGVEPEHHFSIFPQDISKISFVFIFLNFSSNIFFCEKAYYDGTIEKYVMGKGSGKSRIIKKRLSTKSSTLLIRELKKLRVASPKSKVQQRIKRKFFF